MNPLRIAEQLRADYLTLPPPTTTFAPRRRLNRDFRTAVGRDGFLNPGGVSYPLRCLTKSAYL
jgi:hypothetical protein